MERELENKESTWNTKRQPRKKKTHIGDGIDDEKVREPTLYEEEPPMQKAERAQKSEPPTKGGHQPQRA